MESKTNNLIPFDLARCIAGDSVITYNGLPYQYAGFNGAARGRHKLLGWVNNQVISHTEFGTIYTDRDELTSVFDLFMAPTSKVVYHNVYADRVSGISYDDIEAAIVRRVPLPLNIMRFTIHPDGRVQTEVVHVY